MPRVCCNLLPCILRSSNEQPAIGQQVSAYGVKIVVERAGPLQRRHQIALEQVCASGEGDWVRDRRFEDVGVAGEKHEGFGDGGSGHL